MKTSKVSTQKNKPIPTFSVKTVSGEMAWPLNNQIHKDVISVLFQEADAIMHLAHHFPENVYQFVEKIFQTQGKVIFSGVGKSGLVSQKLAATFSSIGIPSFALHPTDALHGDLGMVQPQDLFVALSKSGSSLEFEHIFAFLKNQGNQSVLLCCDKGVLCSKADLFIALPLKREACVLNLAPTSSSTLMMAFGDAVAVCVSKLKNFTKNDYARFHPAGMLGKKLLLKVESVMYQKHDLPFVSVDMKFKDLLGCITGKKLGVGIVVDDKEKLCGIVTDGDLRRACELGPAVFEKTAADIMTKNPKTTTPQILAYDALLEMETYKITALVVLHETQVIGLVHIHDIIKTGLKVLK
ncbi:MAG: KpsF/GutQ family sugar-phosphate isomerase [bacterium]